MAVRSVINFPKMGLYLQLMNIKTNYLGKLPKESIWKSTSLLFLLSTSTESAGTKAEHAVSCRRHI